MLKFKKMHGNGNDFIIIENLTQMHALSKSQIIKMGDRKKGLGFDQLITINPPINSLAFSALIFLPSLHIIIAISSS